MYCDLCSQYIQVRKLFKGGNYSRAETIRGNTVNNCNYQMEFLISDQCGWWAVRAREFTVVAATTTSTPIWWITTGNNGSGQNEATAAANLLLQTCLRPFHSIFSDKFLRRQLFFGLIIFSKLSVYSGRLHTLTKHQLSTFPIEMW